MQGFPITPSSRSGPWPYRWGSRTCLMAIINTTPDSFSDGGQYTDTEAAFKQAKFSLECGADVIDIGGQSTRPGASYINPKEELARVLPVLKMIKKEYPSSIVSIDTFSSDVAYEVLSEGASWINDISGGRLDREILKVVKTYNCPYVITHSRGNSQSMNDQQNYSNLLQEVYVELSDNTEIAVNHGINASQIIWDIGIGFAKNTEQNLELLRNLEFFKKSKMPLLIGTSRKKFLGEILSESIPKNRIYGNAATIARCVDANIDLVRVHDVKEMSQVISVSEKIFPKNI